MLNMLKVGAKAYLRPRAPTLAVHLPEDEVTEAVLLLVLQILDLYILTANSCHPAGGSPSDCRILGGLCT